ncbi:hypothetical protein [Massilia sp. MP_M2]|uniref:hypothetical protein n=1 Tax=Massilia sp. MP_M2 TaxID=3071713 RepID=UPI00319DF023
MAKVILMALAATAVNAQAATVVVSGGSSMVQSASGEEKRLSSLRVDCASYNRTNVGFLCAFDDGQRTILQFEEQEGLPVRLFDADGTPIAGVRRVGSYHVLPQLYRTVFARVGNKEAAIVRDASAGGSGYAAGTMPLPSVASPAVRSGPAQTVAGVSPTRSAAPVIAAGSAGSKAIRPDQLKRDWVLKTSHSTLEEALEEFASRIDYELVYENRELLLNLKRDIPIARNADFWEMLAVLGETYRKSDAAFQIIPTDFKQIVVVPMGQENTAIAPR